MDVLFEDENDNDDEDDEPACFGDPVLPGEFPADALPMPAKMRRMAHQAERV